MSAPLGSRRYWAYGALAAVLVALNVWRWWPDADAGPVPGPLAPMTDGATFRPEDFQVAREFTRPTAGGKVTRNPFAVGAPPPSKVVARKAPRKAKAAPKPTPEALAAARSQAARKTAREALGRFKVAAIRLDAGRRQALLLNDAGTHVVVLGDLVGERYRVDDISFDAVRLTDTVTRVSEHIPLTGN